MTNQTVPYGGMPLIDSGLLESGRQSLLMQMDGKLYFLASAGDINFCGFYQGSGLSNGIKQKNGTEALVLVDSVHELVLKAIRALHPDSVIYAGPEFSSRYVLGQIYELEGPSLIHGEVQPFTKMANLTTREMGIIVKAMRAIGWEMDLNEGRRGDVEQQAEWRRDLQNLIAARPDVRKAVMDGLLLAYNLYKDTRKDPYLAVMDEPTPKNIGYLPNQTEAPVVIDRSAIRIRPNHADLQDRLEGLFAMSLELCGVPCEEGLDAAFDRYARGESYAWPKPEQQPYLFGKLVQIVAEYGQQGADVARQA
ncbi:hypothetical protein GC177_07965 [bacterium]|nr:hypothetical protein [bacterium]